MFRRKVYTGIFLLLLFGIYWLSLLPILAIRTNLEQGQFMLALLIWGVLCGIFFIPALAVIIKKAWFFKGKGEPVVLDLLWSILASVNEMNAPIRVQKHGKKLIVSWHYKDPHWCEHLEKTDMKRIYELWLHFDNNTKTVSMTDRYRSINWDLSPVSVTTGRFSLVRPFLKVETGDAWGVENYEDTDPQDYTYTPNEIKSPVMNSILKNGWNVRFNLF